MPGGGNGRSGTAVFRENLVSIFMHDRRLWIFMDIHGYIHGYPRNICAYGYGYGYGWQISYPRQAWSSPSLFCRCVTMGTQYAYAAAGRCHGLRLARPAYVFVLVICIVKTLSPPLATPYRAAPFWAAYPLKCDSPRPNFDPPRSPRTVTVKISLTKGARVDIFTDCGSVNSRFPTAGLGSYCAGVSRKKVLSSQRDQA